jgi:hypothetical protein
MKETMPQRDDKIGVHYGRVSQADWDRMTNRPAAIVEKAVKLLVEARKTGPGHSLSIHSEGGIIQETLAHPGNRGGPGRDQRGDRPSPNTAHPRRGRSVFPNCSGR